MNIYMEGNSGYAVLPEISVVWFPEGRFPSAQDAADFFFRGIGKLESIGTSYRPFPGSANRVDVQAYSIRDDARYSVEMTNEWARVYLLPPKRSSNTREELEGQELTCLYVPERMAELTGGTWKQAKDTNQ